MATRKQQTQTSKDDESFLHRINSKRKMATRQAIEYLGILLQGVSAYFQAVGLLLIQAFQEAASRFGWHLGIAGTVAVGYQVYAAFATGGTSLLFAPFAAAVDTVVIAGVTLLVDASLTAVFHGGKTLGEGIVDLYNGWKARRMVASQMKTAQDTMRAVN